jgi:hypothetical protein
LFRGFSSEDLGGIGVGFSLFDMPALANLAARIVAEEVALRRPMSVVIAPMAATSPAGIASASSSSTTRHAEPVTVAASGAPAAVATPADERSFDVTVRLALAPTVA